MKDLPGSTTRSPVPSPDQCPAGSYESPHLLMAMNLVLSALVAGFIGCLIARRFSIRGTPGLLMSGCGVSAGNLPSAPGRLRPFLAAGTDTTSGLFLRPCFRGSVR
jgi:hypothetical protein